MPNPLYELTILPPKNAAFDAVTQDITALQKQFGGEIVYLNPNHVPLLRLPRVFFGFHKLREIQNKEAQTDVHHFWNPDLFPFPVLRFLNHPVIYSITGGIHKTPINKTFFESIPAITVGDERSLKILKTWGLQNTHLVRPGIETERFSYTPQPFERQIRILVGSAPWTKTQFQSKGINALLEAAKNNPQLHLICLWRGVLFKEFYKKVYRLNLQDRVTIVNEKVDVNSILATVHASIALATDPTVIRPYPYSLLESIAAGKPVLISKSIPMADYVNHRGCGKVINDLTPEGILSAIELLCQDYRKAELSSRYIAKHDFSLQTMIETFGGIYDRIL